MVTQSKEELINIAVKTYIAKQYTETIKICEKVLADNANNVRAYHGIALSLMMQKKYDLALEMYDKAIALNPLNSKLYMQRGETLFQRRWYHQAAHDFEKAKRLEAKNTAEADRKISSMRLATGDVKYSYGKNIYNSYSQSVKDTDDYNYDMQEVIEDYYDYFRDWEEYTHE